MSVDYLSSLVGRSFGLIPVVQPRLPALFEPARSGAEPQLMDTVEDDLSVEFEETQEREPSRAVLPSAQSSRALNRMARANAPVDAPTGPGAPQVSATEVVATVVHAASPAMGAVRGPRTVQVLLADPVSAHVSAETPTQSVSPTVENAPTSSHTSEAESHRRSVASSADSCQTPPDRGASPPELLVRQTPDAPPPLPSARRVASRLAHVQTHMDVSLPSPNPGRDPESAAPGRAAPMPVASADEPRARDQRDPATLNPRAISVPTIAHAEAPASTSNSTRRTTPSVGIVVRPGVRQRLEPMRPPLETAPPSAPTIQVTIGRVELRATSPATPPRTPRSGPHVMSLDDYLKQRGGGSA